MTPEGKLQADIIELLVRLGHLVTRVNSGGTGNRQASRWYVDEPTARTRGAFDLFSLAPNGQMYYLDPKATRKPSPEQLEFAEAARQRGAIVAFPRSLEEVLEVIKP